jgi:hypothetical protein
MEGEEENIPPTQNSEKFFMTPPQGEKKREGPPGIERQRNPEPFQPSEQLRQKLGQAFRELNVGFITLNQALRMSRTQADNQFFTEEYKKIKDHIDSFVVTGGRRKTKKNKTKKGKRK